MRFPAFTLSCFLLHPRSLQQTILRHPIDQPTPVTSSTVQQCINGRQSHHHRLRVSWRNARARQHFVRLPSATGLSTCYCPRRRTSRGIGCGCSGRTYCRSSVCIFPRRLPCGIVKLTISQTGRRTLNCFTQSAAEKRDYDWNDHAELLAGLDRVDRERGEIE